MDRAEELFRRLIDEGEPALDQMIEDRASEDLFLDFKASADSGSGKSLRDADRKKLAKAISGFGNSEGGVIVWGVDCENSSDFGDVASKKRPIQNPERFKSWLEYEVSGCTLPPHSEVRHQVIKGSSADYGFVVTYVPKSWRAPHQCIKGDRDNPRYFMRVGSNFVSVPHGVLAGMFGQRPQPRILHEWLVESASVSSGNDGPVVIVSPAPRGAPYLLVTTVLKNEGPTIARDVYLNVEIGLPGAKSVCQVISLENQQNTHWTHRAPNDVLHHFVSRDDYRLAPGATSRPACLEIYFVPPIAQPLEIRITYGATGTHVTEDRRFITASECEEFCQKLRSREEAAAKQLATGWFGGNGSSERP